MTDSTVETFAVPDGSVRSAPRRTVLDVLESDAIAALRDIAGEYERPVLPRTADRASKVLLRLAEKAFWPARGPIAIVGPYDVADRRPDLVVTAELLLRAWTEVDVRRYLAREGLDPRRASDVGEDADGGLVVDDSPGRLPVQYVTRPMGRDYRAYAGQVSSGTFRPGDEVVVLPSRRRTTVVAVDTYDGELGVAVAGQSVSLRLADEVDVSRGDVIARADDAPDLTRDVVVGLTWHLDPPLRVGDRVQLRHATRRTQAIARSIDADSGTLAAGETATVVLRTADPLPVVAHGDDPALGAVSVVDPDTRATLADGPIRHGSAGR